MFAQEESINQRQSLLLREIKIAVHLIAWLNTNLFYLFTLTFWFYLEYRTSTDNRDTSRPNRWHRNAQSPACEMHCLQEARKNKETFDAENTTVTPRSYPTVSIYLTVLMSYGIEDF